MPADGGPTNGFQPFSEAHVQAGCTPEGALASTAPGDGWLNGEPMSLDAMPAHPLAFSPFQLSDATSMEALLDGFQPLSLIQPPQLQEDVSPGQPVALISSFGHLSWDSMC